MSMEETTVDKHENKKNALHTDEEMLKKILIRECGDCDTDEFAADQVELGSDRYFPVPSDAEEQNEEFAQDEEIGEPDYFSTCDFTMIGDEDGLIDYQGS